MTIQVFGDPVTLNTRKVLAALDHMKTAYTLKHISYGAAQHKSVEYLKINPNATVPAAVDGDLVLTESNAILQYAADMTGVGNHPLYPKDLKQRANINRWLFWEASVWFPSCYVYYSEYLLKPILGGQLDENGVKKEQVRWKRCAKILDDQLSKTKWITGDDITLADFAVAAPLQLHEASRFPLENYPNLKRWMTRGVEQLPAWKNTQAVVEAALLPNRTPAH